MFQNARKSALWPANISADHVSSTGPATRNVSLRILFTPAIVFGNAREPPRFPHFWQGAQSLAPAMRNDIWTCKGGPKLVHFVHFDLEMCFAPQRRALFRHRSFQKCFPKVLRAWPALCILTWKCASRHNGVHFFDIAASKSAVQKCSAHGVLCTFWLGNVLCATTAYTFSTSQLPKVLRLWCVLCILTWQCASRHNGVHFFDISTSKSGLGPSVFYTFDFENVLRATTACNFSPLIWPNGSAPAALASLLFDPPEPQIMGKTQCFTTFLPFRASASSVFWLDSFSSLIFFLIFSSLTLPTSAFSSVHIVGSLTSKLPSMNQQHFCSG